MVERLAADVQKAFPGIEGFSLQNVWYMRAFHLAWVDEVENLQQTVGDSDRAAPRLGRNAALLQRRQNIQALVIRNPFPSILIASANSTEAYTCDSTGPPCP